MSLYATLLLFFLIPDILLIAYLSARDAIPWVPFFSALVIFFFWGSPLDIYATKKKLWSYGFARTWGIKILGMPLEEYLFYFVVMPLPLLLFLFLLS